MNGEAAGPDDELKALQIANARLDSTIKNLDIKLKEFELRHRPGFWKSVVANPGFLAAVIAVCATAATAVLSWAIASQQQKLERTKTELIILSNVALAIKSDDHCGTYDRLNALRGILEDPKVSVQLQKFHTFFKNRCAVHRPSVLKDP